MKEDDDRELRDRFAALRENDRRRVPGFATTVARARARAGRPSRRLLLAGAALAAAVAGFLVIVIHQPLSRPTPTPAVPSITDWKSPTDFLLATPGREVLGAPPRLGQGFPEPDLSQRRTSS